MDAICVNCGAIVPEAELQGLIMAEEENRRQKRRILELLCTVCYMEMIWDWEE